MIVLSNERGMSRWIALVLTVGLLAPLALLPAAAVRAAPRQMTTKKKVVLVAGIALLYYLYRKHQMTTQRTAQANATAAAQKPPQLYRSKNGGVYYRDPQGKPVWLTVPSQGMQVSTDDLNQYAPDYAKHQGPAPATPSGYKAQSFTSYDPSLVPGSVPGPAGASR
jgi:hypothetical protein